MTMKTTDMTTFDFYLSGFFPVTSA